TGQRVTLSGVEVVDVDGSSLLIRDNQGALYLTGAPQLCQQCQIHAEKVRAKIGSSIDVQTQELRFENRVLSEVLGAVRAAANARVSFTGEIVVKDSTLVVAPQSLQRFNPVTVNGDKLKLRAATLEDLKPLADSFGSGNLLIKVVMPST